MLKVIWWIALATPTRLLTLIPVVEFATGTVEVLVKVARVSVGAKSLKVPLSLKEAGSSSLAWLAI